MPFSVRLSNYQGSTMLNMCDADLLGRHITAQDGRTMHISEGYYGGRLVSRNDAYKLLRESSIINMVGEDAVSMAVELGMGSKDGARVISGVPFMLVFKM